MWLQAASVHDLEPFVLFLDGKKREKRHLANAGELLPRLKATFPGTPPQPLPCMPGASGHGALKPYLSHRALPVCSCPATQRRYCPSNQHNIDPACNVVT